MIALQKRVMVTNILFFQAYVSEETQMWLFYHLTSTLL